MLFVHATSGEFRYTFDWSAQVPVGVAITSVDYTLPAPLFQFADSPDLANKLSTIGVRGVVHGALYQVLAVATLNNGEKIPQSLEVRGFFGTA